MNVFWDLDGTIINPNQRIYMLFCKLTGQNELTYDQYWKYRYSGMRQKMILKKIGYTDDRIESFFDEWMRNIELPEWLLNDTPQPYVKDVLEKLSEREVSQYVITNRQNIDTTKWQIERLGLNNYFDLILTTHQKMTKAVKISVTLKVSPRDMLIGDSVEDIEAAKKLNIYSVSICNDSHSEKELKNAKPDFLIYDRRKIVDLVGE